mmetsp:Transcript_13843/g.21097  ORF Transcript_13843/g.21097 Transcript_13843/m.21097 type:complete len:261 (+) Transcript_13843:54-836(+)|eukprot:CAMPEP_0178916120 /NCGR_PEP_ID=MMETSP0786-20121207/12439_1 /TAXON_ID=186022 /ORGANISM="Thalassionema frauenfeldii, Strain CCMP 1798" /LENGTH=260 /DNA_ID=CAMNT_0020589373 /DNA_START=50 /DNA_END=832 /DNA_ORIENTATION=-
MSSSLKKAGEAVAKQALKVPRAVTAAEAPSIEPAKESTKESMMPWRGWVSRMVRSNLGEERYQALRKLVFYRPDDIHDMHQIPNPSTKVPISATDPTLYRQFRNPSPGSEPGTIRIPKADEGCTTEDPYNITYYTRDTTRRYLDGTNDIEKMKLELMNPDSPEVQEMKENLEPQSSPGNQGVFATGPSDYDPSGLRAAMSTNHAALEESLDANMPDHLPYPVWYDKQDEILAWYEERGLEVPMGATGFGTVPVHRRVARW